MAAAEARSGLPDTLRCATRGRLLEAFNGAPLTARLTPAGPGGPPWTVECLRCGADPLTGELLLDTSRLVLTAAPFLKLVAGGSGSGLMRDCGVCEGASRLMGDDTLELPFNGCRVRALRRTPVMNACCIASSGFIRLSGSHRRQREMKSRKASSSHLRAC